MNRKDWRELCKDNSKSAFAWYNKVRKMLLSREFESLENCDKDAKVIHHLRDTEEQRKYNDEHYELFGFEIDESGNEIFNYGKYVVFWTKEHHSEYHRLSEETRKKISESLRGSNNPWYGKHHSDKTRLLISIKNRGKLVGESHPMYGKHHTEEARKKMSDANKGKIISQEQRLKISNSMRDIIDDAWRKRVSDHIKGLWRDDEYRTNQINRLSGENHPNYGKHLSEETKKKISESLSGENHPNYGKHLSEETKSRIGRANSIALSGKKLSEDTKKRMSESHSGHSVSDETRRKISDDKRIKSLAFTSYKESGGSLSWNDFQRAIKTGSIDMYIYLD